VRPEYGLSSWFPCDNGGHQYWYSISAPKACLIPVEKREAYDMPRPNRLGRTSLLYARSDEHTDPWRKEYAALAEQIAANDSAMPPSDLVSDNGGFASYPRSKLVEEAAIKAVNKWLRKRRYDIEDKQDEWCGYDLLAMPRSGTDTELHVEVKGTSGAVGHFFITRNERRQSKKDPLWRLALVTNALSEPAVVLMTEAQMLERFVLSCLAWEGSERPD